MELKRKRRSSGGKDHPLQIIRFSCFQISADMKIVLIAAIIVSIQDLRIRAYNISYGIIIACRIEVIFPADGWLKFKHHALTGSHSRRRYTLTYVYRIKLVIIVGCIRYVLLGIRIVSEHDKHISKLANTRVKGNRRAVVVECSNILGCVNVTHSRRAVEVREVRNNKELVSIAAVDLCKISFGNCDLIRLIARCGLLCLTYKLIVYFRRAHASGENRRSIASGIICVRVTVAIYYVSCLPHNTRIIVLCPIGIVSVNIKRIEWSELPLERAVIVCLLKYRRIVNVLIIVSKVLCYTALYLSSGVVIYIRRRGVS